MRPHVFVIPKRPILHRRRQHGTPAAPFVIFLHRPPRVAATGTCPRSRPSCRRARRRPQRVVWLAVAGAIAAATVVNLPIAPTSIAEPPSYPGKRLFDALSKRPPSPQAFIPAPTPPPLAEVPPSQPPTQRIASLPTKGSSTPTKAPSWNDAVAFAKSLKTSADKVAAAAVDPAYKPLAKPQPVAPAEPSGRARPQAAAAAQAKPSVTAARQQATAKATQSRQGTGARPPETRRFARLRTLIADTLATYQRRPLNTAANTPWEVMHGFIAFGIPTQIRVGGPGGDLVNAIGWMNMGGRCRGQVMLATSGDRLVAQKGIGVQGHSAQYLAILAQCRVALNSPVSVDSKSFTVADLVEEEKLSCKANTELTFALIGLAHYLPTDAQWQSRDGKAWSLEKLVAEEIEQPIRGAPCGGTHRLFGLAYGCQRRLRAVGTLDGHYARADKFVRDYQQFALTKLQNPDGSFSTEWFKYPADREDDIDRKIQTTGHILEWLVASLDQQDLYQPRVVAATEFLATALAREPSRAWKIGPMGHALHALTIYQERAWGSVLPGGIAAFLGPMKAAPGAPQVATRPEGGARSPTPSDRVPVRR